MANLRRTKLKAIRVGCNASAVGECTTHTEVQALVSKVNKKNGTNHMIKNGVVQDAVSE